MFFFENQRFFPERLFPVETNKDRQRIFWGQNGKIQEQRVFWKNIIIIRNIFQKPALYLRVEYGLGDNVVSFGYGRVFVFSDYRSNF